MPDDLLTDDEQAEGSQEIQEEPKKPTRPDNRFKDLSDKVEMTAKERDEAAARAAKAEKEAEFYKGFNKVTSKFQNASEFQDKIKEKVLSGADLEEATVAVLYKAGKLDMGSVPPPRQSPVGGSAVNSMSNSGDKSINEMSTAEKRAALIDLENETGAVSQMLRRGV